MTKYIILLCGPSGSGKDTSLKMLLEMLYEKNIENKKIIKSYAFATSLKHITTDLTKLFWNVDLDPDMMSDLAYKENEFKNTSVRKLLQQIGTDILRKYLGDDLFAENIITQIQMDHPDIAIISDLRFPNEFERVKNFCTQNDIGLITAFIYRKDNMITHKHISESFYDWLRNHSNVLIENNDTFQTLRDNLSDIVDVVTKF